VRLKKLIIASLAASAVVLSATAVPASAAPAPKSYANCAALNKVYPHGVARAGAHDSVRGKGKPVTNFRVDPNVYKRNDGGALRFSGEHDLDGDNDGIACEKH
jgi:uncharacterized membrane protein